MKQKNEAILSEILEKVDPMEAAIMILGGTAAANGIIPPFTRLLMGLEEGLSGSAFAAGSTPAVTKDLDVAQSSVFGLIAASVTGIPWLLPLSTLLGWGRVSSSGNNFGQTETASEIEKKGQTAAIGLFCSGAVEAIIMYKLVSNPDVMKALIALPGQVIRAAGNAAIIPPLV